MPRRHITQAAGMVLHVLNRGARRQPIFSEHQDYVMWLSLLAEAKSRFAVDLFAYCLMPNHYHLLVRPRVEKELPRFMYWLQMTHSKRWRYVHATIGQGAVYQGRYRACPIQQDGHFLTVCRYIERNAAQARLVTRAEDWPWSSLFERCNKCTRVAVDPWPVAEPTNWIDLVNQGSREGEFDRLRRSVQENIPFGEPGWLPALARRRSGRPRKLTSGEVLRSL